jgi:hypothetical protein
MKKRPRDFSQAAKLVVDIASGQVEDREPTPQEQGKNEAAVILGRQGGIARAAKLTKGQRKEAANKRRLLQRGGRRSRLAPNSWVPRLPLNEAS